jgi:hypothetical protein
MQLRSVQLPLRAVGAAARPALVDIGVLGPRDRLKRAGLALAAGVGGAVVAIPIPIVHLVLVPGALLTGIGLALQRLAQGETFRGARGQCPYCATDQRFTLAGRVRLPKTVYCGSCQRELYLDSEK